MKSILQEDRTRCYICGMNAAFEPLDKHHVFGGLANRKLSEKYGLFVYIHHWKCHLHGVHKNGELAELLKAEAQRKAMNHYGWSVEQFIEIFGKNYL